MHVNLSLRSCLLMMIDGVGCVCNPQSWQSALEDLTCLQGHRCSLHTQLMRPPWSRHQQGLTLAACTSLPGHVPCASESKLAGLLRPF